jgi:hypothetical protein
MVIIKKTFHDVTQCYNYKFKAQKFNNLIGHRNQGGFLDRCVVLNWDCVDWLNTDVTELRSFSPQANYTDRATAASRWN